MKSNNFSAFIFRQKTTSFWDIIILKGGIFIVIYIDVLFVINFFVTFFLLQITAKLSKKQPKTLRFILASAVGGFYSFIIFANELPVYILALTKGFAAMLIVAAAFKFYRVKSFLVTLGLFLASNLVMLGVIIGLCFAVKSDYIVVNNSVVYFNISARGLLVCAFIAYLLSCLVVRIYNRSLSKNEVYKIVIENKEQSVILFALADTGNKLYEPFSNAPVIVADKASVQALVGDSTIRIIPAATVHQSAFMQGFRPDKVTVKTAKGDAVIENVYIAMSENMNNHTFSAILNPEILSV